MNKYPSLSIRQNHIISFEKLKRQKEIRLKSMFDNCSCPAIDSSTNLVGLAGKLLVEHYRASSTLVKGHLSGLFVERMEAPEEIPNSYTSWINYAELITGPEPLFLNKYAPVYAMFDIIDPLPPRPAHDRFFEYIDIPGMPSSDETYSNRAKYIDFNGDYLFRNAKPYRLWQEKRQLHIEENLDTHVAFKMLLEAAVEEAIQLGVPDELLENWAFQYLSDEQGWAMMRLRPGAIPVVAAMRPLRSGFMK